MHSPSSIWSPIREATTFAQRVRASVDSVARDAEEVESGSVDAVERDAEEVCSACSPTRASAHGSEFGSALVERDAEEVCSALCSPTRTEPHGSEFESASVDITPNCLTMHLEQKLLLMCLSSHSRPCSRSCSSGSRWAVRGSHPPTSSSIERAEANQCKEPLATKKEQRTNKVKRSKASWVLISLTSNQWTYAKEEHDTGESNFHIKSRVDSKELGRIKQQERRRFQGIRWDQTTRKK